MPSLYLATAALLVLGIALVLQVCVVIRSVTALRLRSAARAAVISLTLVLIEAAIASHLSYALARGL